PQNHRRETRETRQPAMERSDRCSNFHARSQGADRSWREIGQRNKVSEVTRILDAIEKGDRVAADELLPLVYHELRKLAAHKMAGEAPGQTLQPTALVHEAYLRLVG